jgi:hypothetical protein
LYTGKEKDLEARETVREMLAQNVKPAHIMKAAGIAPRFTESRRS